jgi:vacuolar-type H+-ATPase subunit B/Vma2
MAAPPESIRHSIPELIRESKEARQTADLTVVVGENILERTKELAHAVERRVRKVVSSQKDERPCESR